MTPLELLVSPRPRWVDISVAISEPDHDGAITVRSEHRSHTGRVLQRFCTRWSDPSRPNTEYGHGVSLLHDVKDHAFYGLGLTPLTEIQTIVQTYYGRSMCEGAPEADAVAQIREHVFHELFGLAGRPLVYDQSEQSQAGLLTLYAAGASDDEKDEAFVHMCTIGEELMLPPLREAYARSEPLRRLQAQTRAQPELVDHLLHDVVWCDERELLMRLADNVGFRASVRAYVDEGLHAITVAIQERVRAYVERHDLVRRYGRTFDPTDYALA